MIRVFSTHNIRECKELTGRIWNLRLLNGTMMGRTILYSHHAAGSQFRIWLHTVEKESFQHLFMPEEI